MVYNYYFELAAVFIMVVILYDNKNKMSTFRMDSILFRIVIWCVILESGTSFLSSILLQHTEIVSVGVNMIVATLFSVLQATKIYALATYAFTFINPHYHVRTKGFAAITTLYVINLILAVTTPFTRLYFYFDDQGNYMQGIGTNIEYSFYFLNVILCLIYVLLYRRRLRKKEMSVAVWVAGTIFLGIIIQALFPYLLVIGISVAIAVLYLYLTLENPNDYQDKLTLCGNEYAFKTLISQKCEQKKIFTVVFLDLQKFRYINSLYGTENGDYLLQMVAGFLENEFQKNLVFRIHNDVFTVVFHSPQSAVRSRVAIIKKRFAQPWTVPDGSQIMLDSDCVLCEGPLYFKNHTELLKIGGYMMDKVKERHDCSVLESSAEIAQLCRRKERVEQILRTAMQERTLEVYYQPIVDSRSQSVIGLEALSRLRNEELGNIPPDEFIPIAEENGQIVQLGFYVFEEVCTFIEQQLLNDSNNTVQSVRVNVSSLQCAYPRLCETFQKIMNKHHVPGTMIHMELTESSMLDTPEILHTTMDKMRGYGYGLSLDDYGTGYSNISYLIQFPFDNIKFDKNMTWSYFENEQAHIIMENEFQLLQKLQKEIVVEGIETKEQYEEMKAHGIHLFQGYYFSKPLSKEDCLNYLTAFRTENSL